MISIENEKVFAKLLYSVCYTLTSLSVLIKEGNRQKKTTHRSMHCVLNKFAFHYLYILWKTTHVHVIRHMALLHICTTTIMLRCAPMLSAQLAETGKFYIFVEEKKGKMQLFHPGNDTSHGWYTYTIRCDAICKILLSYKRIDIYLALFCWWKKTHHFLCVVRWCYVNAVTLMIVIVGYEQKIPHYQIPHYKLFKIYSYKIPNMLTSHPQRLRIRQTVEIKAPCWCHPSHRVNSHKKH